MGSICLLVAHEHRSSREVLTAAIQKLRPATEVINLEPDVLDAALLRLQPQLVVCSRLTQAIKASRSDWILLYPDGEHRVEMQLAGYRATAEDLDFSVLLAYIDRLTSSSLYARHKQSHRRRQHMSAGCFKGTTVHRL